MTAFWRSLFALFLLLQEVKIKSLTTWPDGKYGLLKPMTGCPEEWKWKRPGWTDKGFIFQDTVDRYPNNNRSEILHIEGYVGPGFAFRTFCIKSTDAGTSSQSWPNGQYCIHTSRDSSFVGMDSGSIRMYDEEWNNKDTLSSIYGLVIKIYKQYHDYNAYDYTIFFFACKINGNKKIPIELPITKPFYLLPYGSRECQQVKWMVATTEWIKYRTQNKYLYYHYLEGSFPHHEQSKYLWQTRGIKMYYCYYESCNYTLNARKGVFQSPGFPGNYPDGQLCSWRIMVPANHTIRVHFTNFSLGGKDVLEFYKIINGTFHLNITLQGQHKNQVTLTAKRDLMFVFRTDNAHTSTGFRAEYNVFIPCATTTRYWPATENPTTTEQSTSQQTTEPQTTKPQTTGPKPNEPRTTEKRSTEPYTSKLSTTKPDTSKPKTAKHPTDKPKSNALETDNAPITKTHHTQTLSTTTQCYTPKNRSAKSQKGSRVVDSDQPIVVMVIPLIGCILVVLLVIDIAYRCRATTNKAKSNTMDPRTDDCLAVNMTYERGNIPLDQLTDPRTDDPTSNAVDNQPRSRDELPDYEDIDYTQLNQVPPPNRHTDYPECYALKPVGEDAPEVFYHVLEPPAADLDRPTYQNLSEVNHYNLNPIYDPVQSSFAFKDNQHHDQYFA